MCQILSGCLRFVGVVLCVVARESSRGRRFLDVFVCSTCVSDLGFVCSSSMNVYWEGTRDVRSQNNLSAFLYWVGNISTAVELRKVSTLGSFIVDHKTMGGEPIVVQGHGLTFQIGTKECTASPCARCQMGRSGYQFKWIGPWSLRDPSIIVQAPASQ
jgi:hypothetical protein